MKLDSNVRLKLLSSRVSVAGQVDIREIPELAAAGFTILVNHRPDHEENGQPTSAELAQAAADNGLELISAPVRGLPDSEAVEITARVLASLPEEGKALLFCRSGMRSTAAWAMAERSRGADPEALRAAAMAAGYDLSQLPL